MVSHGGEALLGAFQHLLPRVVVGHAGEVVRPALEARLVGLRHPEHPRDHGDGQRDGEAAHDVGFGRRGQGVQQPRDEFAHCRLERVHRAVGEGLLDQVPETRVVGRIGAGKKVRDGRHQGIEVRGPRPEGGSDARAGGGHRGVRTGERGQDLGVAGDQPHGARAVPGHRRLKEPAIHRVRIVEERGILKLGQPGQRLTTGRSTQPRRSRSAARRAVVAAPSIHPATGSITTP